MLFGRIWRCSSAAYGDVLPPHGNVLLPTQERWRRDDVLSPLGDVLSTYGDALPPHGDVRQLQGTCFFRSMPMFFSRRTW